MRFWQHQTFDWKFHAGATARKPVPFWIFLCFRCSRTQKYSKWHWVSGGCGNIKSSIENLMLPQPLENQCRFEFFCFPCSRTQKYAKTTQTSIYVNLSESEFNIFRVVEITVIQIDACFGAVVAALYFRLIIWCCHNRSKTSAVLNICVFPAQSRLFKSKLVLERLRQHCVFDW